MEIPVGNVKSFQVMIFGAVMAGSGLFVGNRINYMPVDQAKSMADMRTQIDSVSRDYQFKLDSQRDKYEAEVDVKTSALEAAQNHYDDLQNQFIRLQAECAEKEKN